MNLKMQSAYPAQDREIHSQLAQLALLRVREEVRIFIVGLFAPIAIGG